MTKPLALISGAAGEIGQSIARRFLRDGYAVALRERTLELADTAAKHVSGTADHVKGFAADHTDRDAMESALNDVVGWGGAPQAVVANAGYAKYSPIVSMSPAVWDRHIDINLSGTFHLCQLAAQHMVAVRQPGSLTLVSSSLALAHSDQVGGYCVTKAALLPLTRTLAAELGVYGIRANVVLPGVVETRMTQIMLVVRADLLDHTPARSCLVHRPDPPESHWPCRWTSTAPVITTCCTRTSRAWTPIRETSALMAPSSP